LALLNKIEEKTNNPTPAEVLVGQRLKQLRTKQGYSLQALAERSRLNVNTLNLVENGKTSPSVSTLHQLALALQVPISTFFTSESNEKQIVFNQLTNRPQALVDGKLVDHTELLH